MGTDPRFESPPLPTHTNLAPSPSFGDSAPHHGQSVAPGMDSSAWPLFLGERAQTSQLSFALGTLPGRFSQLSPVIFAGKIFCQRVCAHVELPSHCPASLFRHFFSVVPSPG